MGKLMSKLIEVNGLIKNYYNLTETLNILKGINFTVNNRETISITGESGSGKSTFLNMLGGLDSATQGTVVINGVDITKLDEDQITTFRNKTIGFIFQSHYLLEEFNAIENVMMPYLIDNFDKKKAKYHAENLLDFMGLKDRLHHYPSQLSGGEKQRVAIARAFINNPSLILADEPTGNLDEKNALKVLELLFDITNQKSHALIVVSHSKQIVKMTKKNYHLECGKLNLVKE